jgi:DNA helicase-2/ATP-dependent DNA helicase PcrA
MILLLMWRAALADPPRGHPAEHVRRGLVDEYGCQRGQADIVRLLVPDGGGLTCVGDDAQAITASAAPIRGTCAT